MNPLLHAIVQQKLSDRFHSLNTEVNFFAVGGGSINETYRLEYSGQLFFCKVNSAVKFPQLFLKEKAGLELLGEQKIIRVPEVIECFESNGLQVLMLEWIPEGNRSENFWKRFGEKLASLHSCTRETFGLHDDNYMGSVQQNNPYTSNWTEFFEYQRLRYMVLKCTGLQLLTNKHLAAFDLLYKRLPSIFEPAVKPSLVHGDLWSGNFMCDDQEQPVLIDPALYYGHSSADLGMTTLFGGFQPAFYSSYQNYTPFPHNHSTQWKVCNLYPLLIHLYLFGRSYLRQIEQTLDEFR